MSLNLYVEMMLINERVIVKMEDRIKKRGNQLIVYVPKELDHHFAEQITPQVDKELDKGLIKQLVFDFSETGFKIGRAHV